MRARSCARPWRRREQASPRVATRDAGSVRHDKLGWADWRCAERAPARLDRVGAQALRALTGSAFGGGVGALGAAAVGAVRKKKKKKTPGGAKKKTPKKGFKIVAYGKAAELEIGK